MLSRGGGVRRPPVTTSAPIDLQGHPAAGLIWVLSGRFAFAFDSCDSFAAWCDDTVRCARVCRPLSGGTRATALVLSIESSVSEEMNMADASARVQPEDSL